MWSGYVGDFIKLVRNNRHADALRAKLEAVGQRVGAFEERSWEQSLEALADVLCLADIDHQWIVVECPMPGANHRADAVLLGESPQGQRQVVVVELKRWLRAHGDAAHWVRFSEREDEPEPIRKLHPSSQVQGYRDYLATYASSLVDRRPESAVHGCVFLHAMPDSRTDLLAEGVSAEDKACNASLATACPAFGRGQGSILARWIGDRLQTPPSRAFVDDFMALRRTPAQRLASQIAAFRQRKHPWALLDHQREAWAEIDRILSDHVARGRAVAQRTVVIVEGQPGSGKTVLAVQSLLTALDRPGFGDSALIATTPEQQQTILNQFSIVRREHPRPAARLRTDPILRILDVYMNEWAQSRLSDKKMKEAGVSSAERDRHLDGWRDSVGALPHPGFSLLVCDEAQGLIDPVKERSRGVKGSGAKWRGGRAWGPQAWHIIANAKVSIFLMDGEQGYRQIETTRPKDIHDIVATERARGESIELLHVKLGSAQFRLNGLSSLCEWIDSLLGLGTNGPRDSALVPPVTPEEAKRVRETFSIVDNPAELRDSLVRDAREHRGSARLLATYAWDWASKADASLVDSEDGKILSSRPPIPGLRFRWLPDDNDAKANFLLGRDAYSSPDGLFGTGVAPVAVAAYPLTVRGQEFAHVGVLWGAHLILRNDGSHVEPRLCPGTDYEMVAGRAAKGDRKATEELRRMVAQALRILLTRGTETVRVWIEDEETRWRARESFNQTFAT